MSDNYRVSLIIGSKISVTAPPWKIIRAFIATNNYHTDWYHFLCWYEANAKHLSARTLTDAQLPIDPQLAQSVMQAKPNLAAGEFQKQYAAVYREKMKRQEEANEDPEPARTLETFLSSITDVRDVFQVNYTTGDGSLFLVPKQFAHPDREGIRLEKLNAFMASKEYPLLVEIAKFLNGVDADVRVISFIEMFG
jgi:hypothetical protein